MAERFSSALWRSVRKISLVAVGHTGKKVEEFLTDQLLYGVVSAYCISAYGWMGPVVTFLVMTPVSILLCLLYIRLYYWAGKDLFGFEALKEMGENIEKEGKIWQCAKRVIRLGDTSAIIVLSILFDPFMTTVYMRRGLEKYDGLDKRSWRIFWTSVVISNGFWSIRWGAIAGIAIEIWPYVRAVF